MRLFIDFYNSKILNSRQKKLLIILLFFVLVSMVLETLGLGVLLPIIDLAINENASESLKNTLDKININLEPDGVRNFVLIGSLILFSFKFIFLNVSIYFKSKFLYGLNSFISNKIYSIYINRGYSSHVKYNSGNLISIVQVEVPNLIAFVKSFISIITEFLLCTGVLVLLLVINFKASFIIITSLFSFFIVYNYITKQFFINWGSTRKKIDSKLSGMVVETLNAFKYVKISKKENFFEKIYGESQIERSKVYIKYATLLEFPRSLIEFIISLFIVIYFLLIFITTGNNLEQLSMIGIYIASAFKILPGLLRLNNSIQNIKFYKNSFSVINDVLKNEQIEKQNETAIEFNTKIELIDFNFRYSENYIFKNSYFKIIRGDIIGIIGESGSGKSTLIDLICGLLPFNSVKIEIEHDKFVYHQKAVRIFKKIGYVTQFIYLLDSSIKKNIAFGIDENKIDEEKVNELVKIVGLDDYIDSKKEGIEFEVGNDGVSISGGQKQRIGIARALYNSPDFLVLDEATSALDIKTENKILKAISNLEFQPTILISTHRNNTLKICDCVYQVRDKKVQNMKI